MTKSTITRSCVLAILLLCLLCVSSECKAPKKGNSHKKKSPQARMQQRYNEWLNKHGRKYSSKDEWNERFGIYQSNVQWIDYINSQNLPYKLAENEYADMTNMEFKSIYTGYKPPKHSHRIKNGTSTQEVKLPVSIDWRKDGAVTPIKNQGQCGSCWAFSAVAAIEGINQIKTGKLISLSEQELVDCDVTNRTQGCNGGYMDEAFKFIIKNGGITTEKDYPYVGKDNKCNTKKCKNKAVKISGYVSIPEHDEATLLAAVAKQPVSVAIDASGYNFQLYFSGVLSGFCGTTLNHGVTIVGYGEEVDGTKYWIVKNSWGTTWGETGYIRMQRNDNFCGIAMMASYPTIH